MLDDILEEFPSRSLEVEQGRALVKNATYKIKGFSHDMMMILGGEGSLDFLNEMIH